MKNEDSHIRFFKTGLGVFVFLALSCGAAHVAGAAHAAGAAPAAGDGPWRLAGAEDLAGAWLDLLFRGAGPAEGAAFVFSQMLRAALGAYGVTMLVIAGFLLLWQIVSMLAETAQSGIVMGRRGNQLWTPMRFLVGLCLLIPLSGGLNVGQSILVKIAAQGSSLASEAWRGAVLLLPDGFFTPVPPRVPDVAPVAANALEMEICRSLYARVHAALLPDPAVLRAGNMEDFSKKPTDKLFGERWIYGNRLFDDAPLCGSYLFPFGAAGESDMARILAERLAVQTRAQGETVAGAFVMEDAAAPTADISAQMAVIAKGQQQFLRSVFEQIHKGKTGDETASAGHAQGGWLAAAALPLHLAARQTDMADMAARALPQVRGPLFGHDVFSRDVWEEAARDDAVLRAMRPEQMARYHLLFERVNESMKKARAWLSRNAVAGLVTREDVRDTMRPFADSEQMGHMLGRAMISGAATFGIFSFLNGFLEAPEEALGASAFSMRPFQSLAETGRRFTEFGNWFLSLCAIGFWTPESALVAGFYGLAALAFMACGACLLYCVPFVPLLRLVFAALGWAAEVLFAVVSLPLVALAHLYPAGEGLPGPLARKAYWMWLGLFLRPVLIVFAFGGGLVFFVLGVALLNGIFAAWIVPVAGVKEGHAFFRAAAALFYALSVLALSNVSFRPVGAMPQRIMEWLGGQSVLLETSAFPPEAVKTARGSQGETLALAALSSGVSSQPFADKTEGRSHGRAARTPATSPSAHFPVFREREILGGAASAEAFARAQSGGSKEAGASAEAGAKSQGGKAAAAALARHSKSQEDKKDLSGETRLLPSEEEETTAQEKRDQARDASDKRNET